MIFTEEKLKNSLKNQEFFNFYVFYGEEGFFIKNSVKKIISSCVFKDLAQFNLKQCFFEDFSFEELQNFVNMPAFSSKKRVFVLKNVETKKFLAKDAEKLINILEKMPKDSIVILTIFEKGFNLKRLAFFKKLLNFKNACFVEFNLKSESWLLAVFLKFLKDKGFFILKEDLLFLIRRCFNSVEKIKLELEKIMAFKLKGEIKRQDILSLTRPQILKNAFDIAKNLLQNDKKNALKIFNKLLEEGVLYLQIFGAISCSFLDLYRAKCAKENGVLIGEILNVFNYKSFEFRIKNAFLNCDFYSFLDIKKYVLLMAKLDLDLKTRNVSKNFLIEKALFFV